MRVSAKLTAMLSLFIVFGISGKSLSQVKQTKTLLSRPSVAGDTKERPDFSFLAKRESIATFDAGVLKSGVKQAITLNLFDDLALDVELTPAFSPSGRSDVWTGAVSNANDSTVILVVYYGNVSEDGSREVRMAGLIDDPDRPLYEISPIDSKSVCIRELMNNFPEESAPLVIPPSQKVASAKQLDPVLDDDLITVTVLPAYTKRARQKVGGTDNMQAIIESAAVAANTAFSKSFTNVQIKLVASVEVNYNEKGSFNTILHRLMKKYDDYMDVVHDLRDRRKADLVTLFVHKNDSCGIGYRMSQDYLDKKDQFASLGFSVVNYNCAVSNYSLAHELGHNFGCSHEAASAPETDNLYSYAYGWKFTAMSKQFRTVMAYGSERRVPFFSTPRRTFRGTQVGDATVAYNARVIRNTAKAVSQFR
jgi:hypothetical protein